MRLRHTSTAIALALMALGAPAWADMEAAKAFLDAEIGTLSVLDRAGQEAEMQWFIDAAVPYAGMEIKVASETLTTHQYEAKQLADACFSTTSPSPIRSWVTFMPVIAKNASANCLASY